MEVFFSVKSPTLETLKVFFFYKQNVAIYAFFSGKIENFRNLTILKHLTNSMSEFGRDFEADVWKRW